MGRVLPMVVLVFSFSVGLGGGGPIADAAPSGTPGGVRLLAVELAAEDPMPGGTFVIVENGGSKRIDLGCWRIVTRRAVLAIRPPTFVPAGSSLRLLFARGDAGNPDSIKLVSKAGRVVDSTPLLNDTKGDDRLFGRTTQGWVLGRHSWPTRLRDGRLVPLGRSGCQ